eukprot:9393550-Lingulodinium_polyedra.AAC.1
MAIRATPAVWAKQAAGTSRGQTNARLERMCSSWTSLRRALARWPARSPACEICPGRARAR